MKKNINITISYKKEIKQLEQKSKKIAQSKENTNEQKIDASLEQNDYKSLLGNLAYKETEKELKELAKVLNDLGDLTKHIADLVSVPEEIKKNEDAEQYNAKLKAYTDTAIFYQYVLTIIDEKLKLEKNDKKKQNTEIYKKLDIIEKNIISVIGGKKNKIIDVEKTSKEHKDILIDLRTYSKKNIKEIEEYQTKDKVDAYIDKSKKLFNNIADYMSFFLAKLYDEAETELGDPPCEYTVMGLGSLPLKQATPYSDLEFAILTENNKYIKDSDPKVRQYFKNLTHLVHFKIINLSETIIENSRYGIDLSHLVHKAVNFDLGGKTPLGRIDKDKPYDLIQTIDRMLKYVKNEDDKMSHIDKALPFILEKVCYIHGDEALLKEYEDKVQGFLKEDYKGKDDSKKYVGLKNYQVRTLKVLEEGATEINYLQHGTSEFKQQLHFKGDLEKLNPVFGDKVEGKLFDVKAEIYRLSDRMVYHLGMYFGINRESTWDIIKELHEQKIISDEGAKNLQKSVTFANNLRLATYSHNDGQRDNMSFFELALEHWPESEKQKFIKETFYLKDAKPLHEFYYVMLRLIEIEKGLCNPESRDQSKKLLQGDKLYADTDYNKGKIHARLLEYDTAIKSMEAAKEGDSKNLDLLQALSFLYRSTKNIDKGVNINKEILQLNYTKCENNPNNTNYLVALAKSYNDLGVAYFIKGEFNEAIKNHEEALKIRKKVCGNTPHSCIADSHNNLGNTYKAKGEYDEALKRHQKALEIRKKVYESKKNHPDIGKSYNNLGNVYKEKGQYDEAIKNHKTALKIMEKAYANSPNHPEIAGTHNNLGVAYQANKDYDEALKSYNTTLKIRKTLYQNYNHPEIAESYNNLGTVYYDKKDYKSAEENCNEALRVYKEVYKSNPNHLNIAKTYNSLGNVHNAKKKYDEAIENHKKTFEIMKEIHKTNLNHPDIAKSYSNLGDVHNAKGGYNKAIENYKKAFKIMKKAYADSPNHPDIAISYNKLCETYYDKWCNIIENDNNLDAKYNAKEFYDKAIKCLSELNILCKVYENSPNHSDIAKSANALKIELSRDESLYNWIIKEYNKNLSNNKTKEEKQVITKQQEEKKIDNDTSKELTTIITSNNDKNKDDKVDLAGDNWDVENNSSS